MRAEEFKLVLESIDIDEDTIEKKLFNDGRYIYMEAVAKNSYADMTYLICQCNGEFSFSYEEYMSVKREIANSTEMNSFFVPIFVFDDLDCETQQYEEAYKKIKTAEDRRNIKDIFEEKKSVYTRKGKVSLEIDDEGINYLEYGKADTLLEDINLEGYIYNISYYQLKKLFVISGKDLFRENIRYGLNKENFTKKKLVKNFEKYLKVGIYNSIRFAGDSAEENEKNIRIKAILELDEESIAKYIPGIFWFNHNGVTIFVSERINRSNSTVEFNSQSASIINGAQTMTNLYKTVNEIKKIVIGLCEKELKDYIAERKPADTTTACFVEQLLDDICKSIYLKTILIEGDKRYVKGISDGLNTQVPISEVDILASSEYVYAINELLASENIRIIKEGEAENRNQISVISFAKKYKIISGIPGTSKNLNKNTVEDILREAAANEKIPELAKKLRMVIDADEWWTRNRQDEIVKVESDEINICKYGRNYYESYVILRMPENTDEDTLSNLFVEFIRDAKLASREKIMPEFKKDELFKEITDIYLESQADQIKGEELGATIKTKLESLKEYLNENKENNYSLSALITRFWESEKISLDEFRVISVKKTEEEYIPLEAYPFTSGTFSELYMNVDYSNPVAVKSYEESLFAKEIKKEFAVFVIEKNEEYRIINIFYIEKFSFAEYEDAAKSVYEKTVTAFKEGDEEGFVKASDGLKFHIRPKAKNADDTFEFSNGKEITKRTFWANKKLIKELLDKYLKGGITSGHDDQKFSTTE